MQNNIIVDKSKKFAIRIIKFCKFLREEKHEYIISKQIMRSGTSIGANIRESINAQSKADFAGKLNIALKEANETEYWLELLVESEIISKSEFDSMYKDVKEIVALLVAIVKTTKNSL